MKMLISEPRYETLLLVPQLVLMLSEEEDEVADAVPFEMPKVERWEK